MTEQELKDILEEKLCDMADALMVYYDPCHIVGNTCKVGDSNPCCTTITCYGSPCRYWQGECTYRNSTCKLWVCRTSVDSTDPKCIQGMTLLAQFGLLFGITKRPIIGTGYVGADRQPN